MSIITHHPDLKVIHIAGPQDSPTPHIGDIVVFEYSSHVIQPEDPIENYTKTCFDSSRLRGVPLRWRVGDDLIAVRGWSLGFPNIHVGESVWLVCPPELAYGELGMFPTVPPNATIAFQIDLLAIETLVPREGAPGKVALVGDEAWLNEPDVETQPDDE